MAKPAGQITIFHNPACGTSRNTLAAIREAGHQPEVVDYLKVGWTKAQLRDILTALNAAPRDILRVRGTPARDLGLTDANTTDDEILDAMVAHPILVERPIVLSPKGAALCRPMDRVLALI